MSKMIWMAVLKLALCAYSSAQVSNTATIDSAKDQYRWAHPEQVKLSPEDYANQRLVFRHGYVGNLKRDGSLYLLAYRSLHKTSFSNSRFTDGFFFVVNKQMASEILDFFQTHADADAFLRADVYVQLVPYTDSNFAAVVLKVEFIADKYKNDDIRSGFPAESIVKTIVRRDVTSSPTPEGTSSFGSDDMPIQAEIDKRIFGDPVLSTLGVTVSVLRGKATLLGTVKSESIKAQLERLVLAVKGVKEIDNQIIVSVAVPEEKKLPELVNSVKTRAGILRVIQYPLNSRDGYRFFVVKLVENEADTYESGQVLFSEKNVYFVSFDNGLHLRQNQSRIGNAEIILVSSAWDSCARCGGDYRIITVWNDGKISVSHSVGSGSDPKIVRRGKILFFYFPRFVAMSGSSSPAETWIWQNGKLHRLRKTRRNP